MPDGDDIMSATDSEKRCRGFIMISKSNRHEIALKKAEEKIFQSNLARYAKELYLYGSTARGEEKWDSDIDLLLVLEPDGYSSRDIKKDIIYLKGTISGDEPDDPEVDLKVVTGDEWRTSGQTYYNNILREGKMLWQRN